MLMTPYDTKPVMRPATTLFVLLNGLGYLLLVVGLIALVAMNPVNWFGIGLAWFGGLYGLVLARFIRRRELGRT